MPNSAPWRPPVSVPRGDSAQISGGRPFAGPPSATPIVASTRAGLEARPGHGPADLAPQAPYRFPESMAKRMQALCRIIIDTYDGDTGRLWTTAADSRELLRRASTLPGFGTQKAKIFVVPLGKQLGVKAPG